MKNKTTLLIVALVVVTIGAVAVLSSDSGLFKGSFYDSTKDDQYTLGDINNTGLTDISDVQCYTLVAKENGNECMKVSLDVADLNCDKEINEGDIDVVTYLVLSKGILPEEVDQDGDNVPDCKKNTFSSFDSTSRHEKNRKTGKGKKLPTTYSEKVTVRGAVSHAGERGSKPVVPEAVSHAGEQGSKPVVPEEIIEEQGDKPIDCLKGSFKNVDLSAIKGIINE